MREGNRPLLLGGHLPPYEFKPGIGCHVGWDREEAVCSECNADSCVTRVVI